MKKLTPAQEANYIKRFVERNNAMVHEAESNIRASINRRELKNYIRDTFIEPNNSLDDIDYTKLVNDKIINSKLEADKYFKNILKSNKPKTTKKIKEAIKNIEIFLINTKII